jgi:hypothetical protein
MLALQPALAVREIFIAGIFSEPNDNGMKQRQAERDVLRH